MIDLSKYKYFVVYTIPSAQVASKTVHGSLIARALRALENMFRTTLIDLAGKGEIISVDPSGYIATEVGKNAIESRYTELYIRSPPNIVDMVASELEASVKQTVYDMAKIGIDGIIIYGELSGIAESLGVEVSDNIYEFADKLAEAISELYRVSGSIADVMAAVGYQTRLNFAVFEVPDKDEFVSWLKKSTSFLVLEKYSILRNAYIAARMLAKNIGYTGSAVNEIKYVQDVIEYAEARRGFLDVTGKRMLRRIKMLYSRFIDFGALKLRIKILKEIGVDPMVVCSATPNFAKNLCSAIISVLVNTV